jgi:iron-sulfur cluster assembly protein
MAISLTQAAAEHVNNMLQKRGKGIGLRLATRKSGCTGYAYVVDYADDIGEDDVVFNTEGVTLVVGSEYLHQLDGMTIDFQKNNALNKGFDFINPNVTDTCGCGESFSV